LIKRRGGRRKVTCDLLADLAGDTPGIRGLPVGKPKGVLLRDGGGRVKGVQLPGSWGARAEGLRGDVLVQVLRERGQGVCPREQGCDGPARFRPHGLPFQQVYTNKGGGTGLKMPKEWTVRRASIICFQDVAGFAWEPTVFVVVLSGFARE